jgi:hypothetical protein
MDLTSLKSLADTKFKHALFRKNLKERVETQLAVAHNGGLFKATMELICFVSLWDPTNPNLFIEDAYGNPIKCDRELLKKQLEEAYQFAMNSWHIDFERSKKLRTANDV